MNSRADMAVPLAMITDCGWSGGWRFWKADCSGGCSGIIWRPAHLALGGWSAYLRRERRAMSQFTYGASALLAISGTAIAIWGIVGGECKPFAAGLVLLFGASVFAVLYLGTRRKEAAAEWPSPSPDR